MSLLLEPVVWLLLELMIQVAGETLAWLGFESVAEAFGARPKPHWAIAGIGCVLLGAITGAVATFLTGRHPTPGMLLPLLAITALPLLVGWLAASFGRRAEAGGRPRPALATFWGGLSFAVGFGATRFVILRAAGGA